MDRPVIYTVRDVADMLKLNPRTVQDYIRSGRLNAAKTTKFYFISEKDLNDFLRNCGFRRKNERQDGTPDYQI